MEPDPRLVEIIKEHVRKRHEATDKGFLFGAERVDLKRLEHLKFEATKRHFTFIIDEPRDRGGTDEGPNPLAYFIAGAASCLMNQYAVLAISRGIRFDDFQMIARGHFNRELGGAFNEIIYDLKISSGAPEKAIREISVEAERMCYAHNTLRKAGVKMVTNLRLNGKELPR